MVELGFKPRLSGPDPEHLALGEKKDVGETVGEGMIQFRDAEL